MKVLIIGPAHPFRGGISDFNEALGKAFTSQNNEVTLLSFKKQYPNFLFPGKTQKRTHEAQHNLNVVSQIHAYNPFNWFKTRKWIKNHAPDLILVRFWTPFMGPALGSILKGIKKTIPVIAITDNIIPHETKMWDRVFTRYFLKRISACITLSKSVADDLEKFNFKLPVRTTPHPIYNHFGEQINKNEARVKLGIDAKGPMVLFFGLVRAYKGLDLLLQALQDKRLSEMKVTLLLAGEFYDKKEKYQQHLKQLQDENRLIMKEYFIPDDEVAAIFCASDLVTQTYHTATQSGVTQIAYHFNRPMLVTNVGGLPEMVPNGKVGYVVEKDPNEIANAIAGFFESMAEDKFYDNIIKEKEKYSWERFVDVINEMYKKLQSHNH